jgi:hypothetical protein
VINCARPCCPAKKGQIPWGLKIESRAVLTVLGALGAIITKTQLRGFWSNFAPFFFVADLVPELNPAQQRERKSAIEGGNYFSSCGGRPSCTTPPGPRALCKVGLAA